MFVHGALCVCYSGQCLMSSMIGNRSGNRGRCAQPCRQKYTMIDIYTGEEINSDGDYLLTKNLNISHDIMADLYTIFNRKFTKGLLLGEVGKDVMNSQVPNNQGRL